MVRPIGFGRRGDRVANTPCGRLSEGGAPSNSNPWERSNSHRTTRCEKPSMSVTPGSNSGRTLSTPSASCLAPRPLGISLAFLYGLLTNPIGCEVNIRDNASLSHTNDYLRQTAISQVITPRAHFRIACATGCLQQLSVDRKLQFCSSLAD